MKYISTTAVTLSLLMAVSPFAVFADQGSGDVNADVTVSADAQVKHSDDGPVEKIRQGLRGLFTGPKEKVGDANEHQGDTENDMHVGTTSIKHLEDKGINGKLNAHSDAGIDARIAKLTDVLTRLDGVQRLSVDMKASLTAAINAQLKVLTDLKAEIQAQGTTTVKDGMNATKDSFRAYALLLPKAAITAAGDRIMTITGQMEALSVKLNARIDAAATAGTDVSTARTALTDFNAKVADAKVQAQAAVSLVANLTLSKDDTQATIDANTAALKSAKEKVDAAKADLKAARADISTVLKNIKGKGQVKADASADTATQ